MAATRRLPLYIRGGGVEVLRFLAILGSAAQVRIGTLDCKFDPNPNRDIPSTDRDTGLQV